MSVTSSLLFPVGETGTVGLNLFLANRSIIDFAGEDLILRLFKSLENGQLNLHTDMGIMTLGKVVGGRPQAWGVEGEGFITFTVELERTPLIEHLIENKIKVTGELLKHQNSISYIVHINKAVNFGREVKLDKFVETKYATRK